MAEAPERSYEVTVETWRAHVASFLTEFYLNPPTAELPVMGSHLVVLPSGVTPKLTPERFEAFYKPDTSAHLDWRLDSVRGHVSQETLLITGGRLKIIGRLALESSEVQSAYNRSFNRQFNRDETTVKVEGLNLKGLVTPPNKGRLSGKVSIFKTS